MADSPTPRPTPPGPAGPAVPEPDAAAEPVSRADVVGLAHQLRTEMAHLRRDLAFRIDAVGERVETVLGHGHARFGLALLAAQCLVAAASLAVVRLIG